MTLQNHHRMFSKVAKRANPTNRQAGFKLELSGAFWNSKARSIISYRLVTVLLDAIMSRPPASVRILAPSSTVTILSKMALTPVTCQAPVATPKAFFPRGT
jgi:hypothetical protein